MAGKRELADRLHSASIRLLRHARSGDTAAGVTAARLSVLSVLVYGDAVTVSELAVAEQVAVPTMTRLLQEMEADGLVTRKRNSDDRRVVLVAATARGRQALERGRHARLELIRDVLATMRPSDRATVSKASDLLLRAIAASAQRG